MKQKIKEAIETGIEIDYNRNEELEEIPFETFDSEIATTAVMELVKEIANEAWIQATKKQIQPESHDEFTAWFEKYII